MRKAAGLAVALFPLCGLALSACGGGGGGDDEISGFSFRAADVNGSSAIMITGGSPPDVTAAQAISQQSEIMFEANLGHRIRIQVDSEGDALRTHPWSYDVNCDRNTCTVFYDDDIVDPIMTKNGVRLARTVSTAVNQHEDGTVGDVSILGYGGWMDHSRFLVDVRTETYAGRASVIGVEGWGMVWGDAPRTNPSTGPFAWNGVMVGRNSDIENSNVSNVVQGDAAVSAELSQAGDMSVDVTFSNIKDLNTGGSIADIAWVDLSVVDGTFESRTILGSFFGPQHEEVAGVFEENNVLGAFGARR